MSMHATGAKAASRERARFADYVAIARIDHWVKHVFVLPGLVLAWLLGNPEFVGIHVGIIALGLLATALASSANYVINEYLDAPFDAFHPTKKSRTSVTRHMSKALVGLEYTILASAATALAFGIGTALGWVMVAFLLSGVIYNVRPMRTKDLVYADVATEAINNPIRLTIGWLLVDPTTLPPSSILFAYWAGGAFLMSTKRLSEYRTIVAAKLVADLKRYRRSFEHYTDARLLLQSVAYAQLTSFFLAVFLVKYRIEYILTFPLLAALFVVYLRMGLREGSSAAAPEKLYRERLLMGLVVVIVAAFGVLTIVDLPILETLTEPSLILIEQGGRTYGP